jgi:hypothetical protein
VRFSIVEGELDVVVSDEHVVEGRLECGGRFSDEVLHQLHVGILDVFTERNPSDRYDDRLPIRSFVDDCNARHPAGLDIEASPFSCVV